MAAHIPKNPLHSSPEPSLSKAELDSIENFVNDKKAHQQAQKGEWQGRLIIVDEKLTYEKSFGFWKRLWKQLFSPKDNFMLKDIAKHIFTRNPKNINPDLLYLFKYYNVHRSTTEKIEPAVIDALIDVTMDNLRKMIAEKDPAKRAPPNIFYFHLRNLPNLKITEILSDLKLEPNDPLLPDLFRYLNYINGPGPRERVISPLLCEKLLVNPQIIAQFMKSEHFKNNNIIHTLKDCAISKLNTMILNPETTFNNIYPYLQLLDSKDINTFVKSITDKQLSLLLNNGLFDYLILNQTPENDRRAVSIKISDLALDNHDKLIKKALFEKLYPEDNSNPCQEALSRQFQTAIQAKKPFPEPKTSEEIANFSKLISAISPKVFLSTNWINPDYQIEPKTSLIMFNKLVEYRKNPEIWKSEGNQFDETAIDQFLKDLKIAKLIVYPDNPSKNRSIFTGARTQEQSNLFNLIHEFFATILQDPTIQPQDYSHLLGSLPEVLAHGYMYIDITQSGTTASDTEHYSRFKKIDNIRFEICKNNTKNNKLFFNGLSDNVEDAPSRYFLSRDKTRKSFQEAWSELGQRVAPHPAPRRRHNREDDYIQT